MHSACHTIALKCLHGKARALIEAACVGGTRIMGKTENLSATYTHPHTHTHNGTKLIHRDQKGLELARDL